MHVNAFQQGIFFFCINFLLYWITKGSLGWGGGVLCKLGDYICLCLYFFTFSVNRTSSLLCWLKRDSIILLRIWWILSFTLFEQRLSLSGGGSRTNALALPAVSLTHIIERVGQVLQGKLRTLYLFFKYVQSCPLSPQQTLSRPWMPVLPSSPFSILWGEWISFKK